MADRKKMLMCKDTTREPLSPISSNRPPTVTPRRVKPHSAISKTPSAKTPKTKDLGSNDGVTYDRFIPNRNMMDKEVSVFFTVSSLQKIYHLVSRKVIILY